MNELLNQFGIQAHVLIGQILLFFIVFFVLKRYVFGPVLQRLEARRGTIEKSLEQAKELENKTRNLQQQIDQQLAEAKLQADRIIQDAKQIGEQARNEILIRTNKEITAMLEKGRLDIAREKETMMQDIKKYITQTSVEIVKKILAEKLDEDTSQKLITESLEELHR